MTDSSGPPTALPGTIPCIGDPALFDMYMDALDVVLRTPEIRQACDEFTLPAAASPDEDDDNAIRVFEAAPREYDAYQQARCPGLATGAAGRVQVTRGSDRDPRDFMRLLVKYASVVSVLAIIGGGASSAVWAPMVALAEAGATVLVVAARLWGVLGSFGGSRYFQSLGVVQLGGIDLDVLRSHLITAVSETELLAQVRTLINMRVRTGLVTSTRSSARQAQRGLRQHKPGPDYGCSELHDLLRQFDGASIGVAGPRGSGKSTLVRQYCDESPDDDDNLDHDSFDLSWLLGTYLPGASTDGPEMFRGGSGRLRSPGFRAASVRDILPRGHRQIQRTEPSQSRGSTVTAFWLRRALLLLRALLWRAVLCTAVVLVLLHWKQAIARTISVPVTWVEYTAIAVDLPECAGFRLGRPLLGSGGGHGSSVGKTITPWLRPPVGICLASAICRPTRPDGQARCSFHGSRRKASIHAASPRPNNRIATRKS